MKIDTNWFVVAIFATTGFFVLQFPDMHRYVAFMIGAVAGILSVVLDKD